MTLKRLQQLSFYPSLVAVGFVLLLLGSCGSRYKINKHLTKARKHILLAEAHGGVWKEKVEEIPIRYVFPGVENKMEVTLPPQGVITEYVTKDSIRFKLKWKYMDVDSAAIRAMVEIECPPVDTTLIQSRIERTLAPPEDRGGWPNGLRLVAVILVLALLMFLLIRK